MTKPLTFAGKRLAINFATSAAGGLRVEIQSAEGAPLPGFEPDSCPPIFGDSIDRGVRWAGGADVGSLAGTPVRLRFEMSDADLYSLQFA